MFTRTVGEKDTRAGELKEASGFVEAAGAGGLVSWLTDRGFFTGESGLSEEEVVPSEEVAEERDPAFVFSMSAAPGPVPGPVTADADAMLLTAALEIVVAAEDIFGGCFAPFGLSKTGRDAKAGCCGSALDGDAGRRGEAEGRGTEEEAEPFPSQEARGAAGF